MSARSWFGALKSRPAPARNRQQRRASGMGAPSIRPLRLEMLEDRRLLAFLPAVSYAAGTNPQAVLTADFDNDTIFDLAVANYSSSDVTILLGNSDGTFQPAPTSATGPNPLSLAVGDFDEDGNFDLATANSYDVSVMLGDGLGSFAAPASIGVVGNPQSVAVGDFNGDGLLDLGVTSNTYYPGYCYYYGCYPGHNVGYANVLLGNGDGTFSGPNPTFLDSASHNSALATDINGDLYDDFVTFHSFGYVSVLLGSNTGFLQSPSFYYTGDYSYSIAAGDVDSDGDNDLVTANIHGHSVGVLLNDGLGGFTGPMTYATGGSPASVALGDFTGDGNLDVATANHASNQVAVLHGGGDGAFSTPVLSAVGSSPWAIAATDFNGDGWLDVATANSSGSNVSVLINDALWPSPPPPPPPPPSIVISDAPAAEGTLEAVFTVTIVGAHNGVTLSYATADSTAAAGSDYTAIVSTLTFAPNELSKTISIPIRDDTLDEHDEEFFVILSGASGGVITDAQGIGTIQDDDEAPGIKINDVTKLEGHKNTTSFVFTVSLTEASGKTVSVNFATANGTATTADSDYLAAGGTVSFAPGQTTATITIIVRGDKRKEANETFFVNLTGATDAAIDDGRGVGTITNDDGGKGNGKGNQLSLADVFLADVSLTTPAKRK